MPVMPEPTTAIFICLSLAFFCVSGPLVHTDHATAPNRVHSKEREMTRLIESAKTSLSPAEAFAAVGDFENVDQWDPGVARAVKRTPGEVAVGTVYDLDLLYRDRSLEMSYTVTEIVPGEKIVLEGSGSVIHAVDVISFAPDGEGTLVTYQADLQLTGIARLMQPLMKSRFAAIGEAAGIGLRSWLRELEWQRT
jgi:carbon monoxide dehydrogenase subunit G